MLPFSRSGLPHTVVGAICLGLVLVVLPPLGDEEVGLAEQTMAYASVLLPVGAFLYGLLALAAMPTRRLLLLGAVAGVFRAFLADLSGATEGFAVPPLALLFLANLLSSGWGPPLPWASLSPAASPRPRWPSS